jgi:hypothetical protein
MAPAPGLGEVVRRLDELAADVRGLRDDLDRMYVRQDVYRSDQRLAAAERRETASEVLAKANEAKRKADDVAQRVEKAENARRTANLAVAVAFLTPIVTALVARALS